MAKSYSTMQTEVQYLVGDDDTDLLIRIKVWLNDAYQDAVSRFMWPELIDHDYTFESVADQSLYDLETDFDEELFVANIADGRELNRMTEQDWWKSRIGAYDNDSIDSGTPRRYLILYESSKIKLDPPPDEAETYAMPYKKIPSDLSADGDEPSINGIDRVMIPYAVGQSFAYKRQFAKADFNINRAESELRKLISKTQSRKNQAYQFKPSRATRKGRTRLLGDSSYDTI